MLKKLKDALVAIHRDERGAVSVEQILILALIALPILVILAIFRGKIVEWFGSQNTSLDKQQAPVN